MDSPLLCIGYVRYELCLSVGIRRVTMEHLVWLNGATLYATRAGDCILLRHLRRHTS